MTFGRRRDIIKKAMAKEARQSVLCKNDVIEADIDDIGCDGEGIAHVDGYTVFVPYALTGERVRAHIILAKPTFAVAKLLAVLRASPDRCAPFCPVFGKCGGCTLQHLSYEAQLRYKRATVQGAFRKTAQTETAVGETVASPKQTSYRNKMSLPVRGTPAVVGFFAAGTHRVVPIESCPIQFEGNGALLRAFCGFLHENHISGYDETTHGGTVRHLSVRMLDGFATVTVVINDPAQEKALLPFDDVLRQLYKEKYAYYINSNTSAGNRILGAVSKRVGGTDVPIRADGLRLCVHPHSFFQVNDGVRELLYAQVVREAAAEEIVDAYSGAGVLSALLSRVARQVTAVEIEPKAVDSARDLLARNHIENVELVCGDCAERLPRIVAEKKDFTLVLDPPRAGCDVRVLDAAIASRPRKIVYVSCNPATLARDAARLGKGGYALARLTPFDMFPHSGNTECLAVLTRGSPDK